jgi:hypothetical protein
VFPPDPTYRSTLPCLPDDCLHAQPPVPVPAPVSLRSYAWSGVSETVFTVQLDTAPRNPVVTQIYCGYFDMDRKWVISERSRKLCVAGLN